MTALKQSGNEALRSWAKIAAFLRCSIRTAQRWEREEQLPVHREGNGQRGTVAAFPRELQAWLSTRDAGTNKSKRLLPEATPSETSEPTSVLDDFCQRARERAARIRGAWLQRTKPA
jgi:phage terminase Nu1 subunit (DNA packaging protein)